MKSANIYNPVMKIPGSSPQKDIDLWKNNMHRVRTMSCETFGQFERIRCSPKGFEPKVNFDPSP